MKRGYYWMKLDDQEWETVEIDDDSMFLCGSDVICRLENGKWKQFGDELGVVILIGPLIPPAYF